ncbi:hypothetical protein EVAR_46444_1 [Eumeta japonica]|uniref:Uncharacterized protein n=1 Tax=Eumeta variegata TaxID=151549 RepID=A0A4C1XEH8_EUMVA|nr:hypothetical protein EVAR_46444_1 [Eumeta japonica]
MILNPDLTLNFGPGLAYDSDPSTVLDSALYPVFYSDFDTSHSFDLNETRATDTTHLVEQSREQKLRLSVDTSSHPLAAPPAGAGRDGRARRALALGKQT